MKRTLVVSLLAVTGLWAQEIKWPASLDHLSQKAKETVDVTLDKSMLGLASKFMSGKDPDEAKAKRIAGGLNGIYVKVFEFEKPGEYSMADVESIRTQLKAPVWKRTVNIRSSKSGENVEVWFKGTGEQIEGLVVLAAEPKELTFVYIDGLIRPEDIDSLSGQFGIPKVETTKPQPKPEAK